MSIPSFQNDHFELNDGEAIHQESPTTFYMPPIEARKNLKAGDLVKLIFRMKEKSSDEISVERMWVIVDRKEGEEYVGKLDNDPVGDVYLKAGDEVRFEPRHVIQIDKK
ncbi:MAG: hypothetical protein A3I29_03345 [Candidatus Magasanikbacteria bacterium RIFCSPLOWO2_02_FULL_44_11]|uniref:DUF2314 domain-containing protein n=2 Tax=Candidatus Magasanikiibacteriota TaxID=1752731 RepID=A0A1F6NAF1_9BACT|nr:MAG: hypothetical protein A3D53_01865 [Candidatus Magasanikbacteria bacterium RIFCSPHIGHO2_02_FULL_45_10]OGH80904.1 MAG: hypothetical protein A3I29_03345 [Candidatus Magasanikbacteria bacterium RIFCSPLOWO2_02_FULL_44_11]